MRDPIDVAIGGQAPFEAGWDGFIKVETLSFAGRSSTMTEVTRRPVAR
jgi:hypothetical protein